RRRQEGLPPRHRREPRSGLRERRHDLRPRPHHDHLRRRARLAHRARAGLARLLAQRLASGAATRLSAPSNVSLVAVSGRSFRHEAHARRWRPCENLVMNDDWRAVNLANWESRVPMHTGPGGYDLASFDDPEYLSGVVSYDRSRLGRLDGLDVVHLQGH